MYVNKQAGFSLLEVMVVLVIIGMIMSIVAPNIMGQQEEAALDKAHLDIQQLEDAMSLYKLKNKAYLTTEQGLEGLVTKTSVEPVPKRFPEGGFISKLPEDPWGNPYQLISPGEVGKFDLFSMGPDGEVGTDDDIGNWDEEK
ncbi:type II secretion system major pseudopilin GspG [Pseudoalteromonas sp. SG43-7]|jgi:general secretion pathway protein G|uniref:Type II secretion system core protein G n=1 Tax=Pseudoalteromonas arctica TaxID=394751 RepID=A0A7Y0DVX3_9GAMM|nr:MULTISPECIES: type II secretion system major pseudopilin GspG [Pseudoalteromonas]MBB1295422.1 type II secretion system major pseudopilin GspG [Pseudoalteromonas sp. SR41-4]MBB1303620.1 type II secretion system major pseudopilin GspG [Pseudoalteromonas sp. SR44-8]MBB1311632.1 type II secretion system major pseudopilin GspG [Pseudoalteromonas sp. SR41-8]MBB1335532.1 type II secretion system major pseudopilin GspG [Pseudoalteromonas sp. SR41-6]MBB1343739.1 type II secretion system major pseudo|tara:strand:- start:21 stop:446 length:426 start_codon:yes stop_codon:yes gene_type:complete